MSGFTVSALTDYVRENADDIYTSSIMKATTLKELPITIQSGIKKTDALMSFTNVADLQADGGCAFNASGSSTFSDKDLTVTKVKWQDVFCPDDLEAKFLSTKLTAGSNYDSLPFEELIIGQVIKNINKHVERMLWQGDTSDAFDPNLKLVDGWLKIIDAGSPVEATSQSDVTEANIISILDEMYTLIPEDLNDDEDKALVAMMGWANFKKLIIAGKKLNYFNWDTGNAFQTGEIFMPGTGLKVKALNGLNDIAGGNADYDDRIILTYAQNLYMGTDLANEYEEAKIWYSDDDQNIKSSIKFKIGTQVRDISEVVSYKNS